MPRGNQPFGGPQTRFNQPVTAERTFAAFSLPVDAMRRVARVFGGKVNDVLLAVVDGGVERYLTALGERPRQPLVAMCPVSMRDEGDLEATTKVATMFVPMARPRSAAARRLQQIVAQQRRGEAGVPRAVESRGAGLRADRVRRLVRVAHSRHGRPHPSRS